MNIFDIKLTYYCNNHCMLCCQDPFIKREDSLLPVSCIRDAITRMNLSEIRNTKVVLTGGEPTMHPDILEILQMLKNAGFPFIQLQSNITLRGLNLSVEDLVNAGVNGFGISLHGSTPSTHEKFTCESGSFYCTVQNLSIISQLKIPVSLNCVISKFNIEDLNNIVYFVSEHKLSNQIQFAFLHITGRADAHHDLVPPISLAAKKVKDAILLGKELGISVKSEAIPFCLMRGFEKNVAELEEFENITILDKNGMLDFSKKRNDCLKEKSQSCKQCLFYSMCEGPWTEYPTLFGWSEFSPIRSIKTNA